LARGIIGHSLQLSAELLAGVARRVEHLLAGL
jgi:hypothetical protein